MQALNTTALHFGNKNLTKFPTLDVLIKNPGHLPGFCITHLTENKE